MSPSLSTSPQAVYLGVIPQELKTAQHRSRDQACDHQTDLRIRGAESAQVVNNCGEKLLLLRAKLPTTYSTNPIRSSDPTFHSCLPSIQMNSPRGNVLQNPPSHTCFSRAPGANRSSRQIEKYSGATRLVILFAHPHQRSQETSESDTILANPRDCLCRRTGRSETNQTELHLRWTLLSPAFAW